LSDREHGPCAPHGRARGRCVRRVAPPCGARTGGGVVVARCDLGGYQPHVRRCGAHGRGVRPGPRRPGPVRSADECGFPRAGPGGGRSRGGPLRSRWVPTPRSTVLSARSRPTPWTATTWTCTEFG